MTTQQSLFHDDVCDAVRHVVSALGGFKAVGTRMRPEMRSDDAGRWLARCLDNERNDKLDLDQLLLILKWGREADCHVGIAFIANACGYETPKPTNPEDEKVRLQRELIAACQRTQEIFHHMQRAGLVHAAEKPPLRAA